MKRSQILISTLVFSTMVFVLQHQQIFAQVANSPRVQVPEKVTATAAEITDEVTNTEATESDDTENSELDEQVRASMLERVRSAATREQVRGALHDLLTQKGGYIGEITRISEDALTLKTRTGSVIVPLTDQVNVLKDDKPQSVDAIAVGNWVTVLGSRESENVVAEFVLVSEASLLPRTQDVAVGSIYELSRRAMTITSRDSQTERSYVITTDTVFQDADGTEADWQDFEADYAVLIVALEDAKTAGTFEVTTVRSLVNLGELSESSNE